MMKRGLMDQVFTQLPDYKNKLCTYGNRSKKNPDCGR
jgi:hypothetical protein